MTLKENGKAKPTKVIKPKNKVKCPICGAAFKVNTGNYEIVGDVLYYYCDECGDVFTNKQI